MDGVWKKVSHKRRGQRAYDPGWDHVTETQWGKDSAPSRPFSARAQFPAPNRPVPPPLLSRNEGAPAKTSAAAADMRRRPADPQFGQLVRKMHAAIKIVHHLQKVAIKPDQPEPRMISRMVNVLTALIKPAAPSTRTTDLIRGNAKNWGHNTLLILVEHYQAELDRVLDDLSASMVRNWQPAFEVATRWARRNLPHITRAALDEAEALIAARGELVAETAVPHQPPVTKHAPVTHQTPAPQQTPAIRQTPVPRPLIPQQPRAPRGRDTRSTPSRVEKPSRPERSLPPREHPRGAGKGEARGCGMKKSPQREEEGDADWSPLLADRGIALDREEESPQVEDSQEAVRSPLLVDREIARKKSADGNRHGSTILTPVPVASNVAQGEKTVESERALRHQDGDSGDSLTPTLTPQQARVLSRINTERKRLRQRTKELRTDRSPRSGIRLGGRPLR